MYNLGMTDEIKKINRNAKALSKLGASKGGKARSAVLTPEQRKEIARKAIKTRWAKEKGTPLEAIEQVSDSLGHTTPIIETQKELTTRPISLFQGELEIGDVVLPCHVLDNYKRVIVQRAVVRAIADRDSGNINRYLTANNISKYIDLGQIENRTIRFSVPGTQYEAIGYEATLLVEICNAYLQAREDGVLAKSQQKLAKKAEIIMRACAKVGIIALIDEATGYQKYREETALRVKLQAFIAEEMQEWARMFPEEFWFELARLENTHYSPRNRPIRWGKYVMAFVYDAVDKDVGKELRKKNPNPHFRKNHHQWLKDFGRDKVRDHLNQVLGVMKMCRDMDDFNRHFGYIFKKEPLQLTFFDIVDTYTKN